MRIVCRWIAAVLVSTAGAAVLVAQAPALDVKMGLWEITSTTDMGGQMPGMDTSKMTPEQRAQVETMMKSMTAHPTVAKICITKEKFDRSSFMTEQPGSSCSQNIATNTSSTLDATVSCNGARGITGQLHFEALSSTSIKGNVTFSNAEQGKTMNMKSAITGQWLGADCGTTK